MTRPAVSPLAEQVYGQLWPLTGQDETLGWALLLLVAVCAHPFAQVDALVGDTDQGPGWSPLFDIDRSPDLDYTAGLVGDRSPEGLTDDQRRDHIRDVGGLRRGMPESLKAAAALHLTGAKTVTLYERDGNAWWDTLITRTAETPDPAAVVAAVNDPTVKPAGRKITCHVYDGWTLDEMEAAYPTLDDLEAAFTTLDALEVNNP
jgi:hypothetical protein